MTGGRLRDDGDTASRILDVAEGLVQIRGFNGFSYADVAAELSLTKASLHYHFPGKAELGRGADHPLRARFNDALAEIDDAGGDAPAKLGRLRPPLRRRPARSPHVPLRDARGRVPDAPDAHARRGHRLLRRERDLARGRALQGREDGALVFAGSPRETARLIVSGLEGAMLVARPYGDVERFEAAADRLLAGFAQT